MRSVTATTFAAPASDRHLTLAAALDARTVPGTLARPEGERVRCLACGHRCLLASGRRGVCRVRFHRDGVLRVPFGYTAGVACDPIEKKPFFHVLPESGALTFGMLGCDLHCGYCQNWFTSQALRDTSARGRFEDATPDELVSAARRLGAQLVVSSYNEPLITAEWAVAVFKRARAAGLLCGFVSNGNATPEVLDFLQPWLAAFKVDLKSFRDRAYRSLGGTLGAVTETICSLHRRGFWVEIVTLLVPGFNDDDHELAEMADFIADVSPEIPWHITAFHPDYRMTDPRRTLTNDLMRAVEVGVEAGLHFVYAGNLPGRVVPWEDTRCPGCGETIIQRRGFHVLANRLTTDGRCPRCSRSIPGIWQPGQARAPAAAAASSAGPGQSPIAPSTG